MRINLCKKTILLLFISIFCLTICCGPTGSRGVTRRQPSHNLSDENLCEDYENIARFATPVLDKNWLTATSVVADKSIEIKAPLPSFSPEDVRRVKLVRDEKEARALADELIVNKFDDYQLGEWSWSVIRDTNLVATYSCDKLWTTNYLDVENDQSGGLLLEREQLFKDYITNIIPNGSNKTPSSAIDIACGFLNDHSDALEFRAYNVLATEDDDLGKGYYTVETQGYYKGIPISRYCDLNTRSVGGTVHVGNNGIFSICALFLLEEVSSEKVAIVDIEKVATKLCEQFYLLINLQDIKINDIDLEYFFLTNEDGSFTLKPVWCFNGSGQQTDLDHRSDFSILFFAEDGSFCGVYR